MNCQSIFAKRAVFLHFIETNKPDIIIGSESWLKPSIKNSEIFPTTYNIYRQDRSDGYGGVFIACNSVLTSYELSINTYNNEIVCCHIELANHHSLIICSIYRPPNNNTTIMDSMCDALENIIQSYPNAIIWIAGDVNLPAIDWQNNTIISTRYNLSINSRLLDLLSDHGLSQIVDFPTRGQNILDIFLTNRPSMITSCTPIPGISDHEAILIHSNTSITLPHPTKRRIYQWNKLNIDTFLLHFNSFKDMFLQSFSSDTPVEQLWLTFKSSCQNCLDNIVPFKYSSTRFNQPWITTFIKRLTRKKQRLYNLARSTNAASIWNEYRKIKKIVQTECHTAYNKYISKLVDPKVDPNHKRLWSYIKHKRRDQVSIPTLQVNNVSYSSSTEKASILNKYFSSVFNNEDTTSVPSIGDSPYPVISDLQINECTVYQLLCQLKNQKASGPDGIPPTLLKTAASEIAPVLTKIFQASYDQSTLPNDWRFASVTPVFKKGSHSDPSNYRPISLTSVCCKLFEHILKLSISNHLENNSILCPQQHGFRQQKSCESQLIVTIDEFAKCLDSGGQIDAIALDFSKAFDKVPHERLCSKLSYYGIQGKTQHWIRQFLHNRYQSVFIEGSHSHSTIVMSGVPQGTVLAPLLFLCYINDLPSTIQSTVRLFADDALVYRQIHSPDDCRILQEDLTSLSSWSNKWLMPFNPKNVNILKLPIKCIQSNLVIL